jgi:hypothetical protein
MTSERAFESRHSCRHCGVYSHYVDTHSDKREDWYCCPAHQLADDKLVCKMIDGRDINEGDDENEELATI